MNTVWIPMNTVFALFLTSHFSSCVNSKQRFNIIRVQSFLSKYFVLISIGFFFSSNENFLHQFFLKLPPIFTNHRSLFCSLCRNICYFSLIKICKRVNSPIIRGIKNAKFLEYCFKNTRTYLGIFSNALVYC